MDREELLRKFHQMDLDGNGVLTLSEVRACVKDSGLDPFQAEEFMALFDLSGDNIVTLSEYIAALGLDPPPPCDVNSWKAAFHSIDVDGSGHLSKDEVKTLLHRIGYGRITDQDIEEWIDRVDTDGDNQISYAEFCTFLSMSYKSRMDQQ